MFLDSSLKVNAVNKSDADTRMLAIIGLLSIASPFLCVKEAEASPLRIF
jgi:hypothetical protein